jgi:hypothetical protein
MKFHSYELYNEAYTLPPLGSPYERKLAHPKSLEQSRTHADEKATLSSQCVKPGEGHGSFRPTLCFWEHLVKDFNFCIFTAYVRVVQHLSPSDQIVFALDPRTKKTLLAILFKIKKAFYLYFNSTYPQMTNYLDTCSDINYIYLQPIQISIEKNVGCLPGGELLVFWGGGRVDYMRDV